MRFKVVVGTHVQNGRSYRAGDVVESASDLMASFKNKFVRADEFAASRGERVEGINRSEIDPGVPPIPPILPASTPTVAPGSRSGAKKGKQAISEPEPPTASDGKDVTVRFDKAVEQDLKVFRVGKGKDAEYFVYDADNLAKSINGEGTDEEGVDTVIADFIKRV